MYIFLKRILDFFLSIVAILILSPLIIVIILVLVVTGEHTVFYRQRRIGYKGKPLYILKFASMLKNSANLGNKEMTVRNDPRVTKVGRILRITKMNELPQLLNVLSGDMSIVGPRPLMEVSYKLYPPEMAQQIYSSRPGITGIGSLIFRDEEKLLSEASNPKAMYQTIFPYKGELELWYKEHASLGTDFKIIILTAWSLVSPKNSLALKLFKGLPQRDFEQRTTVKEPQYSAVLNAE